MFKNVIKRAASILRIVSYVFLLVQWLWVIVLYGSVVVETGAVQTYIDTTRATQKPETQSLIELPESVSQLIAGALLVSMIALSVVLIVRVPKQATQMTIRATKATAKSITPAVQKIAHVPKKQRKQLTEAVLVGVIVVMSGLACVIILPIMSKISLPVAAVWFVSIWLLVLTVSTLLLSTLLGYFLRDHTR
jgi:hypothetical protein